MRTNIFRVENSEGRGCYYKFLNDDDRFRFLRSHDDDKQYHPIPYDDFGIGRSARDSEIHGFESLEQAYRWFTQEELKKLEKLGFFLKVVSVLVITERGRCQVLALRN